MERRSIFRRSAWWDHRDDRNRFRDDRRRELCRLLAQRAMMRVIMRWTIDTRGGRRPFIAAVRRFPNGTRVELRGVAANGDRSARQKTVRRRMVAAVAAGLMRQASEIVRPKSQDQRRQNDRRATRDGRSATRIPMTEKHRRSLRDATPGSRSNTQARPRHSETVASTTMCGCVQTSPIPRIPQDRSTRLAAFGGSRRVAPCASLTMPAQCVRF